MSLHALLELRFDPAKLDEAKTVIGRVLGETRAFDGCTSADVLVDRKDEAHWVITEVWESAEADSLYRKFRAGEGAINDLAPLLAGAPVLTRLVPDTSI